MKHAILTFAFLVLSSSLHAQTFMNVFGDYSTASATGDDAIDFDGWGAGVDLTHWFDNDVYIKVGGGIHNSSFDECIQSICVEADADAIITNLRLGKRFGNVTQFVRASYAQVESTYSISGSSFTDDETEWDYGIGGLFEAGNVIFGLSVDGLRDIDEGFTVLGEITYQVTRTDGISFHIGRLFNVDDVKSTRFGIGWLRFF